MIVCEIHVIVCEVHEITCEIHVITCEINVIICEIHVIVCEVHQIICEINVIVCEIHVIVCEIHEITCEINVIVCEIHVIVREVHEITCEIRVMVFEKEETTWENCIKMSTTFIVVERQFTPSWIHLNIGILPGVSVPVFIQFTGVIPTAENISWHMRKLLTTAFLWKRKEWDTAKA